MYQTGTDLIRAMYRRAQRDTDSRRKDEAARLLDYYHGRQESYIRADIVREYRKDADNPNPVCVNIVRKIARNMAQTYLQDAVRTVDGPAATQKIFAEIEESAALPVRMKSANRLARLLGTVLLRPVWRSGRMDLDVLTPDVLDVDCGDTPEDLRAVQITHYDPAGDGREVSYSVWTPETVTRVDAQGRRVAEDENPYGILPFVPVWDAPVQDVFWQAGLRDLLMTQDEINRLLVTVGFTAHYQGNAVFYIKGAGGFQGANPPAQVINPGTYMYLPENADVGFVSPQAPIAEVMAVVEFLIRQSAVSHGLSGSMMETQATRNGQESGVARQVAARELEEIRRDDIALFTVYERRLFDVFRTVWNAHNPDRQMDAAATISTNFHDPKQYLSATEQAEHWRALLQMKIISPVDILMERDPDLSRDEAKAQIIRARNEIREFGTFIGMP